MPRQIHASLARLLCGLLFCISTAHAADSSPSAGPLTADTPSQTDQGNTFIAPVGWTLSRRANATIVTAPEKDSSVALVDVPEAQAADADAAVAAAWAVYKPDFQAPLKVATDRPNKDGWSRQRIYEYQTSPNERRDVGAVVRYAAGVWTVAIFDLSEPVAGKRGAQIALITSRLLPKGYVRESFAGKKANLLDEKRIGELKRFVEEGRKELGVPGVSLGLIQGEKKTFAGFGVRDIETGAPVDPDTLFMIASNTKALTTLLLAKLVAEGRITWQTPVTALLPSFRLGNPETTRQVLVEHLICACTGLPRQDYEMMFQFGGVTPENGLITLASMQPTTRFGELFQYSNPMASAAGYIAGHVAHPELDLGTGYDRAMEEYIFRPLGMKSTTFSYPKALTANHAAPHAPDINGIVSKVPMDLNYCVIPWRPAGGAWSNVKDMISYVAMELSEGKLPNGKGYIDREPLLERRVPKVAMSKDETYGMGLMVDRTYGVPVVHHGGDLFGYHSDMIWLPEHNVGAVILTGGDPGSILRTIFRRKLLEVLFDGHAEADEQVAAAAKNFYAELAAERKLLTDPADPTEVAKLAGRYRNAALGDILLRTEGAKTIFDFGEWKSPVASKKNPDGTISFVTTAPGASGFEFVVAAGNGRKLVIRDRQHEYIFDGE